MAEQQPGGLYIVGGKTVDANGKATEAVEVETVEPDFEDDQPTKPKTLDDGTVPQLKKLAEREDIDLGTATKKADIIAAIVKGRKAKAALFSLEPEGGDDTPDDAPDGGGTGENAPDGNATPPAGPPAPGAPA